VIAFVPIFGALGDVPEILIGIVAARPSTNTKPWIFPMNMNELSRRNTASGAGAYLHQAGALPIRRAEVFSQC
jgi:hypothetical protein